MDAYLCWPFASKGHFHFPSAIAPVLMDVKARFQYSLNPNASFVYLSDSWNVHGKFTTSQAMSTVLNVPVGDERIKSESLLSAHLEECLVISREIADENISAAKKLMKPLGLLSSGVYSNSGFSELEFRDDSRGSDEYVQERFIEMYKTGLIYLKHEDGKPIFFIDISKMYQQSPQNQLFEGLDVNKNIISVFRNNLNNYVQDLPVSAVGGYATPVPLFINDEGKISIPPADSLPVDPRLVTKNKNHLLIIKPLLNCYLMTELLSVNLGKFESVNYANDYHLATRINFVEHIITKKVWNRKNIFLFAMISNALGERFSYKRGVVQEIKDLEKIDTGLSRFLVLKNTKLREENIKLSIDVQTFKKLIKIMELQTISTKEDIVYSNLFKRDRSITEFCAKNIELGELSKTLNFLIDVLFHNPCNTVAKEYLTLLLHLNT